MNVLRTIDEIEMLVENGKLGFMGKRMINEEEFFTLIQRLRSELPKSMKDAEDLMKKTGTFIESAQSESDRVVNNAGSPPSVETRGASATARDIIVQSNDLTPQEQLQIIAALARRLAGE